jgi:hypothetical protein
MIKAIFKGLLIAGILTLVPAIAYAADLDITCNDGQKPTVTAHVTPLFQLTGFQPGDVVSRTVKVTNTDPKNPCIVSLQGSGSTSTLSDKIAFEIDNIYNKTLSNFIKGDNIQIASLQSNQSVEHTITLTFDKDSDNTLANQNMSFDIKVNSQWGSDASAVLGENTGSNNNQSSNTNSTGNNNQEVLGTETTDASNNTICTTQSFWWIPLAIEFLLTGYILLSSRWYLGNKYIKLILTVALGIIAFFVTKAIGNSCGDPELSKYYWILNIALGFSPVPQIISKELLSKPVIKK